MLQLILQKQFKKMARYEKRLFRGYLFVDTATIKQVIVGLKNWQCNKILRDRELVSRITDQDNVYEEIITTKFW